MIFLREGEVALNEVDFGLLVETFIRDALQRINGEDWLNRHIREWWPKVDSYSRRQIICSIEVSIALDEPPRYNRRPLENKEMWKTIVKELRDPRSPFTVKYECFKCKKEGVKLWRDYNTCADYCELECASCLAPEIKVDDKGKNESEYGPSDQMKGKVPAIPVGETYWGYTSCPSQDVEWWVNLPTYKKEHD